MDGSLTSTNESSPPTVRFETRIVVILRDDLAS